MVKEYAPVINQSTIYCSGCTSGSREKSEVIQIVFSGHQKVSCTVGEILTIIFRCVEVKKCEI